MLVRTKRSSQNPRPGARPPQRLSGIDLNLLVALDALLSDQSVSLAGRRLGLSQPAMSHALAKLRELFGDPLLVRQGGAMRQSELAHRITAEVRRLVADVEATLLGHRTFEPALATRAFRVATDDYCGALLLPGLVARVRRVAPRVTIEVHGFGGDAPMSALLRGELHLALGSFFQAPPGVHTRALFEDGFTCLVRRGHPKVRRSLDLDTFVALDHVLVSSPGYGPGIVDHALAALGLHRNIAVRLPHFLVAPAVVAASDLVVTLPSRISRRIALDALKLVPPPLELGRFEVVAAWSAAAEADAANAWLREVVDETVRAVLG